MADLVRSHVEHEYARRTTATYSGADHIILDSPLEYGRLRRNSGDALCKPYGEFRCLVEMGDGRWPTCKACKRQAIRLIEAGVIAPVEITRARYTDSERILLRKELPLEDLMVDEPLRQKAGHSTKRQDMQTFNPEEHPRSSADGRFTQRRLPQNQFRTRRPFIFDGKEHAIAIATNASADGVNKAVTYQQRDRCFVVHMPSKKSTPKFVAIDDLRQPVYEYRLVAHYNPDGETVSVKITRYTLGEPNSALPVGAETVPLARDGSPDLRGVVCIDPETGDRLYNTSMSIFDSADDPDVSDIAARARKLGRHQMRTLEQSMTDEETRTRILDALEANGLGYAVQDVREQLWSAVGTRMVKSDYEGSSGRILDPIIDASIAAIARSNIGISDGDYYALSGPWLRAVCR